MLARGRRAGAQIFLATPGANLRDCAPFAPVHSARFDSAQSARFDALLADARQARTNGQNGPALKLMAEAAQLDPAHAGLLYQRAAVAEQIPEKQASARQEYRAAADADALRFRPDAALLQVIRDVGRAAGDGVGFVDVEQQLSLVGSAGVPGGGIVLGACAPEL